MGRQRREFSPEYKDEAVKLVVNTGRPVAVVARELGISEQTLGRWVHLFKSRQDAGDGALSESERAEFYAVWSPYNRSQTLRNLLDLAERMRRELGQ